MFANEKPLSRFEVSAIISICVVLFIAAFRDLDHLSWAIPAMTLFSLTGIGLLCGLISASWLFPRAPSGGRAGIRGAAASAQATTK